MPRRANEEALSLRKLVCNITAEAMSLLQAECDSLRGKRAAYVAYGHVVNELILEHLSHDRHNGTSPPSKHKPGRSQERHPQRARYPKKSFSANAQAAGNQ